MGIGGLFKGAIQGLGLGSDGYESIPIPPESVRNALRYEGARLGREHILALAQPKFYGAGVYVAVKALDGDSRQYQLIAELGTSFSQKGSYEGIDGIIKKYFSTELQQPVQAQQVSLIFRRGPDNIEERCANALSGIYQNNQQPVLVAYGAMLGFKQLIEQTPLGGSFYIINPKWIASKRGNIGCKVKKDGMYVSVTPIITAHELGRNPLVLIDDTKSLRPDSGKTIKGLTEYLKQKNAPPVAEERLLLM